MNGLLYGLKKICAKYPLREKRLIVPGYGAGHVLCESLARESGGWLNLRLVTTTGLAQEIAGVFLAERNISFLSNYLVTTVVEKVFLTLKEEGKLVYFNKEGNSGGIVQAISSSVSEMRKTGITSENLSAGAFEIPGKGKDLKACWKHMSDIWLCIISLMRPVC